MKTLRTILLACAVSTAAYAQMPPPGPMPPEDNKVLAHDIFRDIVEVHSVHDVGTKGVADILVRYLKAGGFSDDEIHVVPEDKYPHQVNVIVRLKGKGTGKPNMWMGHMDVVEAKDADWSLPPFKFTEKDGYFYGRGTTDMKDEDAAMAAAMIRLKKEGYVPDRDIIVAFTADEEVGLEQDGPDFLVKNHRDLVDAGVVINTDGGSGEVDNGKHLDFAIETSQKTYITFTLEVTNRGGHSSEPRPDNAIYTLAGGLVRFSHYQFPFKTNATTRLYFKTLAGLKTGQERADLLALSKPKLDVKVAARVAKDVPMNAILHSTCVATMLNAGVQENALAQRAVATVQCRVMPDETVATTKAAIEKVLGDPSIKVQLLGDVVSAPESPPDPKLFAKVNKIVQQMWPGTVVMPNMAAGASDSIFTRNAGIPSYGIGGGWNDIHDLRMHGRDERHEMGDFYSSVEFTYRLMKELSKAE
jgi:acetylornithine deacetylase/succinyl-diaminopimelate desuccinylase-like protein